MILRAIARWAHRLTRGGSLRGCQECRGRYEQLLHEMGGRRGVRILVVGRGDTVAEEADWIRRLFPLARVSCADVAGRRGPSCGGRHAGNTSPSSRGEEEVAEYLILSTTCLRPHQLLAYVLLPRRPGKPKTLFLIANCRITDRLLPCLRRLARYGSDLAAIHALRGVIALVSSCRRAPSRAPIRVLVNVEGGLGDIAMCTPIFRALRGAYPRAYIACRVSMPTGAELLQTSPHLDEAVAIGLYGHRLTRYPRILFQLVRLASYRFDFSLSAMGTPMPFSSSVPFLVGVRRRIGPRCVAGPPLVRFLTHCAPIGRPSDRIGGCLAVVEYAGVTPLGRHMQLSPLPAARKWVDGLLAGSARTPVVVVHPGGSATAPQKRWPTRHFIRLIDQLYAEKQCRILLIGSTEEAPLIERISRGCHAPTEALAGALGIQQLLALVARSDLVVANDSGPMHFALALGSPVVAVFGPTDPRFYIGPVVPPSCRVLRASPFCPPQSECDVYAGLPPEEREMQRPCRSIYGVCTDAVSVSQALEAALDLLDMKREH
jgi:ADP-heptose:LPS heptosyltransferase